MPIHCSCAIQQGNPLVIALDAYPQKEHEEGSKDGHARAEGASCGHQQLMLLSEQKLMDDA